MNQQKFERMNLDNNVYNEIQDLANAGYDWVKDAYYNCQAHSLPLSKTSFSNWERAGFHTGDLEATQKHYELRQRLYDLIQRCAEYEDKMQPTSPWWEADALRKATKQIRGENKLQSSAPTDLDKFLSIACRQKHLQSVGRKVIKQAKAIGVATSDIAAWIDSSGGIVGVLESMKQAA